MSADRETVRLCLHCGKRAKLRCARCKVHWFCDKECLRAAWSAHKPHCVPRSAGRKAAAKYEAEITAAMQACALLENHDVGGCAGKNIVNKVGEFLGLDGSVGALGQVQAQQALMLNDRIPLLRAVADGDYDVHIKSTRERHEGHASEILDCAKVFVKWGPRRQRTTKDFLYFQPGSLACELLMRHKGRPQNVDEGLSPFKELDGGLLYIAGEPDLFWPMVLNFKESGSVLPPCRPNTTVDTLFMSTELDRMMQATVAARNAARSGGQTVQCNSASLAAIELANGFDHPIMSAIGEDDCLPSTPETLPDWWKSMAAFWNSALFRAGVPFASGTEPVATGPRPSTHTRVGRNLRAHCMFHCSPQGCLRTQPGGVCCAWHDPAQVESLQEIINQLGTAESSELWTKFREFTRVQRADQIEKQRKAQKPGS